MMNLNGPVCILDGWNMNARNALVPTVLEKGMDGERAFDLYSRLMRDRIIFVHGPVETQMADIIVGQLLLLEAEDPKKDGFTFAGWGNSSLITNPEEIITDALPVAYSLDIKFTSFNCSLVQFSS